jgi:hypothetical protein
MGFSVGMLIGQLIPLTLFLVAVVVVIRFLLSATRLMNRKADLLQRELESEERREGSAERVRTRVNPG